jgi:hypothetical protein
MKPPIIEGPPGENDQLPPLGKRIGWFIVLWLGGLLCVAGAAYALRALIL